MYTKITAVSVACGICFGLVVFAVSKPNDNKQESDDLNTEEVIAFKIRDIETRFNEIERAIKECSKPKEPVYSSGLVPFHNAVYNLAKSENDTSKRRHYATISLVFEVDDGNEKTATESILQMKPILLDSLIAFLTETTVEDFRGRENLERFRNELKDEFNSLLSQRGHAEHIQSVLFASLKYQ